MNLEEYKKRMRKIHRIPYSDTAHAEGDHLLCEILREQGYGEVVDIYEKIEKP